MGRWEPSTLGTATGRSLPRDQMNTDPWPTNQILISIISHVIILEKDGEKTDKESVVPWYLPDY
jgi:hypothetical protein